MGLMAAVEKKRALKAFKIQPKGVKIKTKRSQDQDKTPPLRKPPSYTVVKAIDRKSRRLNSSTGYISYSVLGWTKKTHTM